MTILSCGTRQETGGKKYLKNIKKCFNQPKKFTHPAVPPQTPWGEDLWSKVYSKLMVSLIMCILLIRMVWLLTHLTLGLVIAAVLPEIVEPGPNSGIRRNTREVCRRNVPTTAELSGWAGKTGNREVIEHTEADTTCCSRCRSSLSLN